MCSALNFQNIEINLKKGDKQSFEKIYCHFRPKLKAFLLQYINEEADVEGLVQDCFIELWERRNCFKKGTNINAWLYTVAKNKALKLLSKEASKQRYIDHEKYAETNLQFDSLNELDVQCFDNEYIKLRIEQSFNKLSSSVRNVFYKRRFEGKTNKEVAKELGISIKTVEAHTTKALKILRKDLKDLF